MLEWGSYWRLTSKINKHPNALPLTERRVQNEKSQHERAAEMEYEHHDLRLSLQTAEQAGMNLHVSNLYSTLCLCALCLLIFFLSHNHDALYVEREAIVQGQWWRLVSGHVLHVDHPHLALNLIAFALLAGYLESHSRTLLWLSLASGLVAVNGLLLSPWSELTRYCGLSGLLNSLFVVALYLSARVLEKRWLVMLIGAYIIKLSFEFLITLNTAATAAWPPYPPAHVTGALGGLAALMVFTGVNRRWQHKPGIVQAKTREAEGVTGEK